MYVPKVPYQYRTAFVFNENAKSVTQRLKKKLVPIIPDGDLYYSRGLVQAREQFRTILERGYGQVFCGGGDGTAMVAINALNLMAQRLRLQLPKIGVLKLGTGNALASVLGAKKPAQDIKHIVNGGLLSSTNIGMVECDDGTMAPFAGMGHEASILNDYNLLKKYFTHTKLKPLMCSSFGYVVAALGFSFPRYLSSRKRSTVRITTLQDAVKMVHESGIDRKVSIAAKTVLYEGPAPIVSLGSIPVYGFNFTMFPFVGQDPQYIQLRVSPCPLATVFSNIYPIWRGTFRHPQLHDFLVKEVLVESDHDLPYQIGGDASGYRNRARFRAAQKPVEMLQVMRSPAIALLGP